MSTPSPTASHPAPLVARPNFGALTQRVLLRYLADNLDYLTGDDAKSTRAEQEATANLVFDRKMDDFSAALGQVEVLNQESKSASDALQAFPKGPMGLTPDDVKFSAPYKEASQRYERAAKALREFNGPFTHRFSKELSEHRMAVRVAKAQAQQPIGESAQVAPVRRARM